MTKTRNSVLATGWGATILRLAHNRKSICVQAPKNQVYSLIDAKMLARELLQLIEEASHRNQGKKL